MEKHQLGEALNVLRNSTPLVHNITNYVVMNNTANALLAVGASPIMAHCRHEVEEMVGIASALVINIGTLDKEWINSMLFAANKAKELKKPAVLDPVGAGASSLRNNAIIDLINTKAFSVLRGNASEIMACAGQVIQSKGVDSTSSSNEAISAAMQLSEKFNMVVCISGEDDYIIKDNSWVKLANGAPIMSKVTGMGCSATALIGAFLGIMDDTYEATICAMAVMGVAGQLAARDVEGPGSFQVKFLDQLHTLTSFQLMEYIKMQHGTA